MSPPPFNSTCSGAPRKVCRLSPRPSSTYWIEASLATRTPPTLPIARRSYDWLASKGSNGPHRRPLRRARPRLRRGRQHLREAPHQRRAKTFWTCCDRFGFPTLAGSPYQSARAVVSPGPHQWVGGRRPLRGGGGRPAGRFLSHRAAGKRADPGHRRPYRPTLEADPSARRFEVSVSLR